MLELTESEKRLYERMSRIKESSGSHSPSLLTVLEKLGEVDLKIDACFLSNPYATDLFIKYFENEVTSKGQLRRLLESYPPQNQNVAEIVGGHLGIPASNIFVGNGATEIIQAILHNFAGPRLLVSIPTFSPYYEFAKEGVEVIFNNLNKESNFAPDIDGYIETVKRAKPTCAILINPNNPDGGYVPMNEMRRMLEHLREVETVVIDESFIHFAFEETGLARVDSTQLFRDHRNVIIVKSMSKDFGIAGLRAGYAVMSRERVSHLLRNGYLWNVSGLADYFFRLYTRADFLLEYEHVRTDYIRKARDFFEALARIPGIRIYPTMANFGLVEILDETPSFIVTTKLLVGHGIYVRDCNDKIGLQGQFLRVAARRSEENGMIVEAFSSLFGGA